MTGQNVKKFFLNETGVHRWQRVPDTEKKGRVHSSTVTVAVMDPNDLREYVLDPNDVTTKYCRSGGKGGQNVNKVETCVVLTHHPSGIMVRCEDTRKRGKNEVIAWQRLKEKLEDIHNRKISGVINDGRAAQIEGKVRRTYKVKNNMAVDHVNGRKSKLKNVLRDNLAILHK